MVLNPPPLQFTSVGATAGGLQPNGSVHAVSLWYAPVLGSAVSVVPPTPVTFGSEAGVLAANSAAVLFGSQAGCEAPLSPDEAKSVIPFLTAAANSACCWLSRAGSMHASASPKLCEMTSPMLLSIAYLVAARMSVSLLLGAISSTMFAPGAVACAHSTSSVVSTDQPNWLARLMSNGGGEPTGVICVNDGLGSPITESKVCRSEAIVGLPKASTMTIVRPVPLMPRLSSGVMLYAFWIWDAW